MPARKKQTQSLLLKPLLLKPLLEALLKLPPPSQALKLAIERAFDKASAMAEAAGMKLGELVSISEAEYSYADNGAYYAKEEVVTDAGAGTEVYASTLQVSATVSVQFALQAVD